MGRANAKRRIQALLALGGRCAQCGNTDLRVLQIDHIDNDGQKDIYIDGRGRYHGNGQKIGRDIARGVRSTEGFQALCANCHHLKSWAVNPYWDEVLAELSHAQ